MTDRSVTSDSAVQQIDYLATEETYVDGLSGLQVRNGAAKLNFFATRRGQDGRDEGVGVATLVITLADFVSMVAGLNQMVRQLQDQGILPGAPAHQATAEPMAEPQEEQHHDHHEHHEHHEHHHE